MRNEINDFFNGITNCPIFWLGSLKGNRSPTKNKVFEIYIYVLVAKYINSSHWSIKRIKNINNKFFFRGSPNKLWSNDKYGFVEITDPDGKEYELHLGIEVRGNSGVNQEVDIGLYSKKDTEFARNKKTDSDNVKGRNALLAIECKNYQSTKLNKALARLYVGQAIDITGDFYVGEKKGHRSRILVSTKEDDAEENVSKMLKYYNLGLIHGFEKTSDIKKDQLKKYIDNIRGL